MLFQNRLATLTSVIDDSKSDLDAALTNLSTAIGEVQRFVAGSRNETTEQVQKLTALTQILVDNKMALQNLLHIAPNAIANFDNIYYPNGGSVTGAFSLANFANPVFFFCGLIGGVANTTAPETAKLCAQYLGPALRLLSVNNIPLPINPYLRPAPSPDRLIFTDPKIAPGGAGPGDPPEPAPTVSAYTGQDGDIPPPPGWGAPQGGPDGIYGHRTATALPFRRPRCTRGRRFRGRPTSSRTFRRDRPPWTACCFLRRLHRRLPGPPLPAEVGSP